MKLFAIVWILVGAAMLAASVVLLLTRRRDTRHDVRLHWPSLLGVWRMGTLSGTQALSL